MRKIPVIFDCDPGHDDAIALLLALSSDILDIQAVTAVCGNSLVDNTTLNALKILEIAGRNDIPVARGASRPIIAEPSPGKNVHGASGMDGPKLPEPTAKPSPLSAVELMARIVEASPEPVTFIVTGPCTNIGIFLLSYPHLIEKIALVSLMGGGFQLGNRTPVGEFNIWHDPEAAQILMKSGIPVDIYGLDVTHKALIQKDEFELFRKQGNEVSTFVADLLDFFAIYYTGTAKLTGCPMHDSCAVAGLIDPRMFTYRRCYVEIDLDGRYSRGGMNADLRPDARRKIPCNGRIALDVDRKAFLELLLRSCEILTERKGRAK